MNTTLTTKKIATTTLLAATCGIAVAVVTSRIVHASNNPKVIKISAKKFEFTPNEITLKKGEPVILRLVSSDRVHGFMSKPLNIDTDISPSKETDVAITPSSVGRYTIICDHYCGAGHGNMKMKITVVE